jgi:hypothetical protein
MRNLMLAAVSAVVLSGSAALAQSGSSTAPASAGPAATAATCPAAPGTAVAQPCPTGPEIAGSIAVVDVVASTVALTDGKVFKVPTDLGVAKLKIGEKVRIKYAEKDGIFTATEIKTDHEG